MTTNRIKQRGFLLTEVIVSIALLGLALTALAASLRGTAMVNEFQWARRQCVNAAEAQLDSLVTVGKPIGEAEIQRLWPGVDVAIDRTPAEPPWSGLQLLRVTATGQAGARQVVIRLERYVRMDQG